MGEDGASEGDEEAAATCAGAESEASAAEVAREVAAVGADDVTGRDRRWIHEYDRGDEGALGDGAAEEEEEVLDRRRAFIARPALPCPAPRPPPSHLPTAY